MISLHTFTRYVISGFCGGVWGTFVNLMTGSLAAAVLVAMIAAILAVWVMDAVRREP